MSGSYDSALMVYLKRDRLSRVEPIIMRQSKIRARSKLFPLLELFPKNLFLTVIIRNFNQNLLGVDPCVHPAIEKFIQLMDAHTGAPLHRKHTLLF